MKEYTPKLIPPRSWHLLSRPPRADPPGPDPPRTRPPRTRPSWSRHPPRADTPQVADCSIQSTSSQYASYWNAFLFQVKVETNKQGMLFSIVPCFGNTWFLLCLEWLDVNWLSRCVCLEALHSDCFYGMWYLLCLEILHSDCFCCMWYFYHAFSLDEHPSSPAGGRIFCCPCILIGWVVWRRKRHPLLKWLQIVL